MRIPQLNRATYRTRVLAWLMGVLAVFNLLAAGAGPPSEALETGLRSSAPPPSEFVTLFDHLRVRGARPAYVPPPTAHLPPIAAPPHEPDPEPAPMGDAPVAVLAAPQPEPAPAEEPAVYEATQLTISERPGPIALQIEYPEAARAEEIQGVVHVMFVVEPTGTTSGARIVTSVHPLCDEAALRAIRSAIFKPGRVNGKPVRTRVRLPIRFEITG